jgi:threonine dehydrogenase-like Zn-dependent dehydrogenase
LGQRTGGAPRTVRQHGRGLGQTHVPRYHERLLKTIEAGEIDPSFVITHRLTLEDGPTASNTFCDKRDDCTKVVLMP